MKEYSVREVAQMFSTNEETVRRWIREKRLEATQSSKKQGNRITDEQLRAFIRKMPKYAAAYTAATAALAPAATLGLGMTVLGATALGPIGVGIAGTAMLGQWLNKKKKDDPSMEKDLLEFVTEQEQQIRDREEQLQREAAKLESDKAEIEAIKQMLKDQNTTEEEK